MYIFILKNGENLMSNVSKDLVAASSKIFILSILMNGESYGYKILQAVKLLTDGQWVWSDGLIYPLLHKLEEKKYISSRWEQIENKRNRRYYSITEKGMEFLEISTTEWKFVNASLQKVWRVKICKQVEN
jgi:DNA-binding PadR family transcriptional regulator